MGKFGILGGKTNVFVNLGEGNVKFLREKKIKNI